MTNTNSNFYKSKLGLISRKINSNAAKVPLRVLNKFLKRTKPSIVNIIILGLSFKGDFPNTDVRDSTAKEFADQCLSKNFNTYVYDPYFTRKEILSFGYKYYDISVSVKKDINFIFVLNNCDVFKNLDTSRWIQSNTFKVFFDGWGILPELNFNKKNFYYTTMGKLE